MAALVDTYKAKAVGKDASTTVTIAGYEVDVKVNVSAAAGNALTLKDDGLYVPTPEEVDISGKADKVTGATTGNFAALQEACRLCGRRGWQAPDDRCRGRKAGRCL